MEERVAGGVGLHKSWQRWQDIGWRKCGWRVLVGRKRKIFLQVERGKKRRASCIGEKRRDRLGLVGWRCKHGLKYDNLGVQSAYGASRQSVDWDLLKYVELLGAWELCKREEKRKLLRLVIHGRKAQPNRPLHGRKKQKPLGRGLDVHEACTRPACRNEMESQPLGPVCWPFGPSYVACHWAWDTIGPGLGQKLG